MKTIRHIMGSPRGFTLIELLVSISILIVVVGIFGAGLFQVLSIQRFWTADIKATREVRHAASWFAGDALNATDVLDAVGGSRLTCTPSPSATLTWTDSSGDSHDALYSVSGQVLLRDFYTNGTSNGSPLTMADRVVANSVSFTLCSGSTGYTLRLKLDVLPDSSATDSLDLITFVRKLN